MERYEYKVVSLGFNIWSGKAKHDYYEILKEYGADGWRFIQFTPVPAKPSKAESGMEMIFERKVTIPSM